MKTIRHNSVRPTIRRAISAAAVGAALLHPCHSWAGISPTPMQNTQTSQHAANQAASSPIQQTAESGTDAAGATQVATSHSQDVTQSGTSLLQPEPLAITINRGLSGLAEEVIPALAQPNYFSFPTAYFWEQEHVSCLRVDAGIKNSSISAPVTTASVTGFFGNDGKVFADVDLDAVIRTTFFWDVEVAPGFTACDLVAAVDNVADWFVNLFGGNTGGSQTADDVSYEQLTLTARGLTADVDLTLALSGSALQLQSIDELNVELGTIEYSGTPLLELLTELAAAGINLAFGDVTDFINDQINANVIPEQEPRLQEIVNTALQQNLAVEQSIAFGGYSASVSVEPANLNSSRSENTMTLEFNFDVSSSVLNATCAGGLGFFSSPLGVPEQSRSDFDVQIPHWVLARVIYEAGRQGLFCQSTLMPFSSEPWNVQPNGSLSVKNGRFTATETTSSGFPVSVEYHRGELLLTVPMLFSGDGVGYAGTATADLEAYFTLSIPEGDRSLYLSVTEVGLANVSGGLTLLNGRKVDMSGVLDTFLNAAADRLANSLSAIPVLPRITSFSDGLGIEIDQVLINDSHTTVGVNIVVPLTNTGGGMVISGSIQNDSGHVRFPDEEDLPDFDTGPRDQIDPLP